ncbi:MAG: sigma-54-dependent transcriptional regulator [Pseudomonadota bacterium]
MSAQGRSVILIVNRDKKVCAALRRCLAEDYTVVTAAAAAETSRLLEGREVDLVLCDQQLSEMSGVDFLHQLRVSHPEIVRILITDDTDPANVIKAINEAAVYQFIPKPWQPEQLRLIVKRALEGCELARRHRYLSRELKFAEDVLWKQNDRMVRLLQDIYEFDKLVFASDAMVEVCNLARKAAVTDLPVLIQGETGTGKELMARAVHFFSGRQAFPFLAQNCGAFPDELLHSELFGHKRGAFTGAISDRLGLFPAADGGTVFLDEISEVSPAFQVSLLRFLQEGEVKPLGTNQTRQCNVRIIAAANRPLAELVEQGKFRRDLYYRLRGFEITIPPLRERPADIPVLAEHAVHKYAASINRKIAGLGFEVVQRLKAYAFPGNVRELENEMRRMVAMAEDGEILTVKHMSPELARLTAPPDQALPTDFLTGVGTLKERVEALEMHLVTQTLLKHKWNHSRAARELGLSRVGLANKVRRYKLNEKSV